jgi:hypothetical protein
MAAAESAYVAKSSFAVFTDGIPRSIREGDMVAADDPLVGRGSPQRGLFEPVSDFIRSSTAPPPVVRPTEPARPRVEEPRRRNRRNQPKENNDMVHSLPPEHEDSPASVFAPMQPTAGVVADDVDEKGQNPRGGPKASEFKPSEEEVKAFSEPTTGHTGEAGDFDADQAAQADEDAKSAKAADARKSADKK